VDPKRSGVCCCCAVVLIIKKMCVYVPFKFILEIEFNVMTLTITP